MLADERIETALRNGPPEVVAMPEIHRRPHEQPIHNAG
jgi:hypothetical protein